MALAASSSLAYEKIRKVERDIKRVGEERGEREWGERHTAFFLTPNSCCA
jgi:hypothetical protein